MYDDKSDPDDGQDAHEDKVDDNGDLQVEEALALGANPNMRGHDGSTALMQVVSSSCNIIFLPLSIPPTILTHPTPHACCATD